MGSVRTIPRERPSTMIGQRKECGERVLAYYSEALRMALANTCSRDNVWGWQQQQVVLKYTRPQSQSYNKIPIYDLGEWWDLLKFNPLTKRNENIWCELGGGSFSTAWHDLPQLVDSFSIIYVAYTYDIFRTIRKFRRLRYDATELLAELQTCPSKDFSAILWSSGGNNEWIVHENFTNREYGPTVCAPFLHKVTEQYWHWTI